MEAPSFLLARASELTAALRMLITEGAKTIYVSDSEADYVLLVWRVRGDLASSHGVSVVLRPSGVFVTFSILSSSGQPPLLTSDVRIGSLTTEMAVLAQAIHRFGEAELSALNLPAQGVDWSRFSTQFARNRHELIERMQAEKEQATAALTSQPDFSAGKLTDPSNGRPATAASVEAPELRDGLTVNDLRQVVRIAQAISSAEAEQMTVAEDEEGRPTLVWQLSNIYGFNARVVFVRRKQHMITTTTITSSTDENHLPEYWTAGHLRTAQSEAHRTRSTGIWYKPVHSAPPSSESAPTGVRDRAPRLPHRKSVGSSTDLGREARYWRSAGTPTLTMPGH